MNCRLDVQKYLNRQVKTVVNNLGSFDDSGFAYVTKDFNVNNLKEIKALNENFKFTFLEHKKSDNTDLPDYVQMNVSDDLVQHYINKYNKKQVETQARQVQLEDAERLGIEEVDYDDNYLFAKLKESDLISENTEELYPDSGLNEINNENKITSNKEIFFRGKTSISANEALRNAIDADIFQSDDKVAFFLQRLMNLQDKSGATVKLIDKYHPFYEQFTENVLMLFNSTNNMIYVTEESLQNFSKEAMAHALVHEIVHSTTIKAFIDPKTFEERDFRDFILKAFEQYKHLATLRDPNGRLMYGFTNPVEFIAEVYSNPDFRAELESIEKNWIQKFFDFIRRLVGLKKDLFNDGLIKTAVLFDVVDYFSERDVSEWDGTLVRDPRYNVYGLIAKESEIPKIDSLDSKLEELINTQLNNLEGMRRRAAAAIRKGSKKSDTFLKNVEKVADEVEKYMDIDKLSSINNYADFMIDQINHISQTLKENPSRLEMLDTIERYRSYLGASDLYKSIMDTLTDVRLKDLPKEQVELAEEILNKLENIGGKHSRIISLFKNYTVDNLRKELSKTGYNSKVLKDFENELLKNYPKESGISRREWLNQELHKPENREILQQRIDADINDVLDGLSADISAWDRFVYSSLSTKSRLIQIVQKIIASAQSKITEAVRLNDIKLNKLYEDLVKEKGKYDISNLLDKDSDGKTYLKGQYSAEFRRLFNDEYAPHLDKLQSIIAKHGRNITRYTKDPEYAEIFDKVQAFRDKHMVKYGNKWIPSDKYKNNLKFSKAEQAIYDEYLDLVKSSTKFFNNKESLVKDTVGVKYYELPYRTISDMERILTNKVNIKDTLKQKKSEFLDWKIDDVDQYEKAYDSMGNEINHIPVLFRNRLTKAHDKNAYLRSIKEQSTDLLTLMRFEHLNQTNYKIKSENEVTLNSIINVAKEKSYYKTDPGTSNVVKNFFGKHKKYVNLEGESNEYKRLKSVVNQHLYNVFKEQGFKIGGKDVNKIIQSINKHTAFLGMSINYFQAPVNVLNAEFQNFLLKIGKDIDNNTLSKAHLEYSKELPMILKDTTRPVAMSKVNQLNLLMDIWGGFNESQNDFIKNSILKNYASTHTLQALQNGGEHLVQSVLNIAILMSIKVMNDKGQYIDKDGNVVSQDKAASLYDMAKVDKDTGEVKFEGFTYTDKSIVTEWSNGGFENVKLYIKHKVHMAMGEYDKNYQNEAQRYWFGQLLFMFKKYLIPLGLNRYRGGIGSMFKAKEDISEVDKHWNEALQDYEEGFYITFGRFLVGGVFKDGLANSLNQLKWDIYRQKWEDLSDYEKGNIRKAIAELGVIVLLNTVVVPFLMASAAGDDDDTLWYLALMGRRLDQELSQYLDISEAYKVTKNPIASLNMIEDLLKAVKFGATPTAWFAQDQNDRFIATKIAEKLVIPSALRVDKNSKSMLNYMNRDLVRPYKETMFYQIFSEEN